jgi:hypothetical protein
MQDDLSSESTVTCKRDRNCTINIRYELVYAPGNACRAASGGTSAGECMRQFWMNSAGVSCSSSCVAPSWREGANAGAGHAERPSQGEKR